jgi:uncharacterized Fe-S cluster-containing MiaB family protein
MKKVSKAIKAFQNLNEEERTELEEFFAKEEVEKEVEKEELKVEEKKEEVKEVVKETKQDFVTQDKLNDILAQILGKVALKEEVEDIKVDKKKAKAFGSDGKTIVNETDDRDNRLAKILSDLNG